MEKQSQQKELDRLRESVRAKDEQILGLLEVSQEVDVDWGRLERQETVV